MIRILAAIALIAIFFGGYWYVSRHGIQDPVKLYEKASAIPEVSKAQEFVKSKVVGWEPDPEDPAVKIPKNWQGSEITVGEYTFRAYSPDSEMPPRYYISFKYPKPLIAKTNLIKCWETSAEKTTDICVVGNNAAIDAYFAIMKFVKMPDFGNLIPSVEMN